MAQCAIVDNGACGAHILPIHGSRFYNFFFIQLWRLRLAC